MADVEEGPAARVTDERIRKCLDAVLWATQSADEHTSHVCIALPIMDDVAKVLNARPSANPGEVTALREATEDDRFARAFREAQRVAGVTGNMEPYARELSGRLRQMDKRAKAANSALVDLRAWHSEWMEHVAQVNAHALRLQDKLAAAERARDELAARLAPIAAETREILPIYDGMPDSHIASVPVGFVRAVDAVAAALSHRSVASELGAEPSELGALAALREQLVSRDAALRESQAAAEWEIAELRVSECWHRDRCTDLEREVKAAERERDDARDGKDHQRTERRRNTVRGVIAWLYRRADQMADSHARGILNSAAHELGLVNAVDKPAKNAGALAADGAGRAGGEDGGRGAGGVDDGEG